MELEELAERLSAIESKDAQKGFMDKYGAKFSNDEGIGVAILGELNRRGIDTSAADAAVQEIIDTLRGEASALLDKLSAVESAVQAATGEQVSEPMPTPPISPEVPPEGVAAPLQPTLPPGGASEAAPPPPGAEPPPIDVLSDARFKNIRQTVLSDERIKSVFPNLSDDELKIIEALSGLEGITDDDIIEVLTEDRADPEAGMAKFDEKLDAASVPEEEAIAADSLIEDLATSGGLEALAMARPSAEPDLVMENLTSDLNLKDIKGTQPVELDEGRVIMQALLGK